MARCRRLADRLGFIDLLGAQPLEPQQYVDDITVACPSLGALRAVVHPTEDSACKRYSLRAKAQFNYKPGKSAALALLGSPVAGLSTVGCEFVETHVLLGVLVDDALTFQPFLRDVVRKARGIFLELLHAGETGGFSFPIMCAQVLVRIEPFLLYGAALLAVAPGADVVFNRLQQFFARALLGCTCFTALAWPLTLATCGWEMRLGSKILEYAVVARARLFLLPVDHPAARMFSSALMSPAASWATLIKRRMDAARPRILDLFEHPSFSQEDVDLARTDKVFRKNVLQRYRWDVVRPCLIETDAARYHKVACNIVQPLGLPFAAFINFPQRLCQQWLSWQPSPGGWIQLRAWALVRITGKWPYTLLGDDLTASISHCRLCGTLGVVVMHVLVQCPIAHMELLPCLTQLGIAPHQQNQPLVVLPFLFGVCEDSTLQWEVIKSVGRVVLGAMGYSQDFSLLDSSGDTVDVDAARVLALQQRATELSSNMFEDGVWAEEDMTE